MWRGAAVNAGVGVREGFGLGLGVRLASTEGMGVASLLPRKTQPLAATSKQLTKKNTVIIRRWFITKGFPT
jgi:hypothetical protein